MDPISLVVAGLLSWAILGSGFMTLRQKRQQRVEQVRKHNRQLADRADRDHFRTLRGDPRGIYGDHMPAEVFEVTEDDQFVDEWDTCELCPHRGNAHRPGKPIAVYQGEVLKLNRPYRLCKACYRECAYGKQHRFNEALPAPARLSYVADLHAWLEAESEWATNLELWLEAEKRSQRLNRPANVTDFNEAAKRLGREQRLQRLAVGEQETVFKRPLSAQRLRYGPGGTPP